MPGTKMFIYSAAQDLISKLLTDSIEAPAIAIRPHFTDRDIPILNANHLIEQAHPILESFYRKPLPNSQDITVRNLKNQTVLWNSLSIKEKSKILEHYNKGGINLNLAIEYEGPKFCEPHIPRWTHGQMHASRAAILVRALANMYNQYAATSLSEREILLAQFLAIFHDSARQAEGIDLWDNESAENAYPFLINLGVDADIAQECVQILKDKDSQKENKHILSKLIQSADCLEIMRVFNYEGFDERYLDIFNDLKANDQFVSELSQFREEYYKFIKRTDSGLLRLYLECHSKNYFKDTLSLIDVKEGNHPLFPMLSKWFNCQAPKLKAGTKIVFEASGYEHWGNYIAIKQLNAGTHSCTILIDCNGSLVFFKEQTEEDSEIEQMASSIANIITGDITPIAQKVKIGSKNGTLQPFIDIETYLDDNDVEFDPSTLSLQQQIQYFVHMIADYVIKNYDAHTGQFSKDENGNIIGFDKGEAFRSLHANSYESFFKDEPFTFDPNFYWPPLGNDQPTYVIFCNYLKQNPKVLKSILEAPEVTSAFQKCTTYPLIRMVQQAAHKISPNPVEVNKATSRCLDVKKSFLSYFNIQ